MTRPAVRASRKVEARRGRYGCPSACCCTCPFEIAMGRGAHYVSRQTRWSAGCTPAGDRIVVGTGARLPDALEAMKQIAYVPVPGIGSVALLFPSVIPRLSIDPLVEFTVRIPSSAARGARIDWRRLCRYGADSAALYRAYLSVCATMDGVAFKAAPITRWIGAPVLNSDRQPRRRRGGAIVRRSDNSIPTPAPRWHPCGPTRTLRGSSDGTQRTGSAAGMLEERSNDYPTTA